MYTLTTFLVTCKNTGVKLNIVFNLILRYRLKGVVYLAYQYRTFKDIYELRNYLTQDAAIVVFVKANGEKRVMLCTRNTAMIYKICPGIGTAISSRENKMDKDKDIVVVDVLKADVRAFVFSKVLRVYEVGDLRNADDNLKARNILDEVNNEIKNHTFSMGGFNEL